MDKKPPIDELENRRRKLASPKEYTENLTSEMIEKMSQQEIDALKSQHEFEGKLLDAMSIDVPENLADKILLQHRTRKSYSRFSRWAVAASIATVAIISSVIPSNSQLSLSAEAIAHVNHESKYLSLSEVMTNDAVHASLQRSGFKLSHLPKQVVFATRCGLAGEDSMHMIARIDDQPVSLLMTRVNSNEREFSIDNQVGKLIAGIDSNIIIIANEEGLISKMLNQLRGI